MSANAAKPKALDFECAIITGAGGGLGKAMAAFLLKEGKRVILVGRTESNLQAASADLGGAPYYVLDTGRVEDIPAFVERVTREHPDVDALINNAGVQRVLDVHALDLARLDGELDVNVRGPIHLFAALLPHFERKERGAVVMNVTSVLGFVPSSIVNPGYNGTKAYMHFWTMAARAQLKDTKIRLIEIVPPAVGTDLHRDRADPDDNKKHKNPVALTVDEFMDDLVAGWRADQDLVSAGPGKETTRTWQDTFGVRFDKAAAEYKP